MDGAYVANLDEYSDIGTYWMALYALNNNVTNNVNNNVTVTVLELNIFQNKLKNLSMDLLLQKIFLYWIY